MQQALPEIQATGATVMALSVDPPERSRGVTARLGLGYPLLCDPEGRVLDALGLRHGGGKPGGGDVARPATLVFDQGRIAWRFVPENWRIRLRPEQLVAALRALPAPK